MLGVHTTKRSTRSVLTWPTYILIRSGACASIFNSKHLTRPYSVQLGWLCHNSRQQIKIDGVDHLRLAPTPNGAGSWRECPQIQTAWFHGDSFRKLKLKTQCCLGCCLTILCWQLIVVRTPQLWQRLRVLLSWLWAQTSVCPVLHWVCNQRNIHLLDCQTT